MNTASGKQKSLYENTRDLLHRYGFRTRKRLGQHFLVDDDVLAKILETAALQSSDVVVEVGPGLGIMTAAMAAKAGRVIAVELDDTLAGKLAECAADNVRVVNENILDIDPGELITPHESYKVVANLPYYITQPVLRHFLEASVKPDFMVVMVQKEVAESIVAKGGRRSTLTNAVQVYGRPEIVMAVPRKCFYPAPQVDSAVVSIEVLPRPSIDLPDPEAFFRLVRAGFSATRKQLVNSLVKGLALSRETVMQILEEAEIDQTRRAETLELVEWAHLLEVLNRKKELISYVDTAGPVQD